MSKSTGNFLTLSEGVEKNTADGMRFALADAGDSLDDANFETATATAALLRLYAQIKWTEEILAAKNTMKSSTSHTFLDRVFNSQINKAVIETETHYERTNFREALRTGFYELQAARDAYRQNVGSVEGMNKDLILRFIEVQALIMAPIIPHFSEYVWKLLSKTGSIRVASYPTHEKVDNTVIAQMEYLDTIIHSFRLRRELYMKPKGKKNENIELPPPTKATIMVAKSYPPWMQKAISIVAPLVKNNNVWPDDKEYSKILQTDPEIKKMMKQVMGFLSVLKEEFQTKGASVLNLELAFDEKQLLIAEIEMLKRALELKDIQVEYSEDSTKCQPGKPFVTFG